MNAIKNLYDIHVRKNYPNKIFNEYEIIKHERNDGSSSYSYDYDKVRIHFYYTNIWCSYNFDYLSKYNVYVDNILVMESPLISE